MDDLHEQTNLLAPEEEEEEAEEQIVEEEESSDDYFSHCSTDSSIDLSEYKHLLHQHPAVSLGLPPPPEISVSSDEEEEEALQSESGTEILSEETELSDESAWEQEAPKPREEKQLFVEKSPEVSTERISDTKVEMEEYALEQMSYEMEEMEEEEEEEEEEEQVEDEVFEEWEKERKIAQFHKDLEEVLNYEFPETIAEEEGMKLAMYESMLKELEKEDKEIDIMIRQLDRNEKTIHVIEKTLGPLITHYEKEMSAFRKVGDGSFMELEGEEEEEEEEHEEVEDEGMSRAAEMAREILEADDIESVGSLGKESSGDDFSLMLEQMAAELKESEPEPEKEEVSGAKKAPNKQKRKTAVARRISMKAKTEPKKKKK